MARLKEGIRLVEYVSVANHTLSLVRKERERPLTSQIGPMLVGARTPRKASKRARRSSCSMLKEKEKHFISTERRMGPVGLICWSISLSRGVVLIHKRE